MLDVRFALYNFLHYEMFVYFHGYYGIIVTITVYWIEYRIQLHFLYDITKFWPNL